MTSILFFLPALFLLVVVIAYFFREKKQSRSFANVEKMSFNLKLIALLAVVFPYIAGALILISGSSQPIAHFKLEGYKFSLQPEKNQPRLITIGGSPQNDIYIQDFPQDSLLIKKEEGELKLKKGKYYDGLETVRIEKRIPGLVALQHGSQISIQSRGKSSDFEISHTGLLAGKLKVIHNDQSYVIPWRTSAIPIINREIPLITYSNAYSRIFPLGKLLSPENWREKGYRSSILFGDFQAENMKDKMFEPYFLVLDPGVSVDGREIDPFDQLVLEDGKPLTFIRIAGIQTPRLRTELKFKEVRVFNHAVEFYLERPQTIAIKRSGQDDQNRFIVGNLENFTGEILQFEKVSENFTDYFAILDLKKQSITASGPFTNEELSYNKILEVGSDDKLLISVSRKETPWNLVGILLFTAAAVAFFSHKLIDKLRYLVIFGSIAILTTSRFIFSYSASVLPPFSLEAVPLAIFLLVFAPSLVVAVDSFVKALECKDKDFLEKRTLYVLDGIVALLFTIFAGISHVFSLSFMLFLGALFPVLFLMACLVLVLFLHRLPLLDSKINKSRSQAQNFFYKISNKTLFIIGIAFVLIRVGLFIFGNKESVNLGARFSISIFTVSLLVLFIALCTTRYIGEVLSPRIKKYRKIIFRYIGFVFGFCAIFFISALLSSDLGQMIYALPICLFLTAMAYWSFGKFPRKEKKFTLLLAAPLVLIIIVLAFPLQTLQVVEFIVEGDFKLNKITDTDVVTNEQNILRLMNYVAPQHLKEVGSRSAEAVAQHHAIMEANTQRGWLGEGYGNIKVPKSLYKTCLNDNVGAVYLISQFGVLGALTIIIAYSLLLISSYRTREEMRDQGSQFWKFASPLSILSSLVLIFVSLYMLGANCNLFLFTGRNLYFLGLNSMSDIYESVILLAFIIAGISIGDVFTKTNGPERPDNSHLGEKIKKGFKMLEEKIEDLDKSIKKIDEPAAIEKIDKE